MTELKTGCVTDTIAKKDLGQLGVSVDWCTAKHPEVKALPVMLHRSRTADQYGTPVPGMRVVTPAKYELLRTAVMKYATALAGDLGNWGEEQAVAAQLAQLAQNKLTGAVFFSTYAETCRTTP